MHLNEKLLSKNKISDASQTDKTVVNSAVVKDLQRKQSTLVAFIKYTSMFPQKVCQYAKNLDEFKFFIQLICFV